MERVRFENADAVQNAVAQANYDNTQIRETAQKLRLELEKLKFEKDDAVQLAVSHANSEISQTKATVVSLRNELEKLKFDKNEAVHSRPLPIAHRKTLN